MSEYSSETCYVCEFSQDCIKYYGNPHDGCTDKFKPKSKPMPSGKSVGNVGRKPMAKRIVEGMAYEEIGKLTVDLFLAEKERIAARIERAKARDGHHCAVEHEYFEDDTGACESFCYHPQGWRGEIQPFDEWCDNCKFVQPFHLKYIDAAQKARVAKYKLNRKIKRLLENEAANG